MKLSIAIVPCPRCGVPLIAKDMSDRDLAGAKCNVCGREFVVRTNSLTEETVVKEKKTN